MRNDYSKFKKKFFFYKYGDNQKKYTLVYQ